MRKFNFTRFPLFSLVLMHLNNVQKSYRRECFATGSTVTTVFYCFWTLSENSFWQISAGGINIKKNSKSFFFFADQYKYRTQWLGTSGLLGQHNEHAQHCCQYLISGADVHILTKSVTLGQRRSTVLNQVEGFERPKRGQELFHLHNKSLDRETLESEFKPSCFYRVNSKCPLFKYSTFGSKAIGLNLTCTEDSYNSKGLSLSCQWLFPRAGGTPPPKNQRL